jgi:hypothetical protein
MELEELMRTDSYVCTYNKKKTGIIQSIGISVPIFKKIFRNWKLLQGSREQ